MVFLSNSSMKMATMRFMRQIPINTKNSVKIHDAAGRVMWVRGSIWVKLRLPVQAMTLGDMIHLGVGLCGRLMQLAKL